MLVHVGFSDNPDSQTAGLEAARQALRRAGRNDACDFVLLFATARHNSVALRKAVLSVTGDVPVYGGGAVGLISNDRFGYAGDQAGLALFWLDGISCDFFVQHGLENGEEAAGRALGERLGQDGDARHRPLLLLYDAISMNGRTPRMNMATYLLKGIEQGLGFLPDINGAGLQGDHQCSQAPLWIGEGEAKHCALAMRFGGPVVMDSVIMHGCRPATGYYTATRADNQTILEINGQPALPFLEKLLGPALRREHFPFFLLFGVNSGDKWGEFNEEEYASRLCFGLDEKRDGIVMFEPDMSAGTEFQIMYRSLDLRYMKPRIEQLFSNLDGRKAVFALYIDCAGRAAGYGGTDLEDALVVGQTVGKRAPLLGIYTGVEIASVHGRPRGLDWTGVFCLFSTPQ